MQTSTEAEENLRVIRSLMEKATIYRARKKLGSQIVDSSGRRRRDNLWALEGQQEENEEEVDAAADDDDV